MNRDDIASKFQGLAARARRGPTSAIRLFCIECMGGSYNDAKRCETRACFLWPFGLAARHQKASLQPTTQEGIGALEATKGVR